MIDRSTTECSGCVTSTGSRWFKGLWGIGMPFLWSAILPNQAFDVFHRFPLGVVFVMGIYGMTFSRWATPSWLNSEKHLQRRCRFYFRDIPRSAWAFTASCFQCGFDWFHGFACAQIYFAVLCFEWLDSQVVAEVLSKFSRSSIKTN